MKLRFPADRRTALWAFVLFPAVALTPFVLPRAAVWTAPLALYVGFCAGVLAHNQNHCPTFSGRRANSFYAAWLSVFYGYPTFAWIPTHNRNHHKFRNRPGDATVTWRYSKKNTWLVAATYFFVSAYWQSAPIAAFVRRARSDDAGLYRQIVGQRLTVAVAHLGFLALAVGVRGWKVGLVTYASGFGTSAAMGLWGMMFMNYIQHVHCDPWSLHDHSRNFEGRLGNWLVFNNGLHTVHHEHPGAHWSRLPKLHAAVAGEIHPDLRQPSLVGFCLRAYLLGSLSDRFRTRQIGRAADDIEGGHAAAAPA